MNIKEVSNNTDEFDTSKLELEISDFVKKNIQNPKERQELFFAINEASNFVNESMKFKDELQTDEDFENYEDVNKTIDFNDRKNQNFRKALAEMEGIYGQIDFSQLLNAKDSKKKKKN